MFFAFDVYGGVVIKNNLSGWSYDKNSNILESYSNEDIWEIAEQLEVKKNQDLLEVLVGLCLEMLDALVWK